MPACGKSSARRRRFTIKFPDRWQLQHPNIRRFNSRRANVSKPNPRWYDPFNRNKLKGDDHLRRRSSVQQTFILTATSETLSTVAAFFLPQQRQHV